MPQSGSITDSNAISSKRADTSNYVVYPKNSSRHGQTKELGQFLQIVVIGVKDLHSHGSDLGVAVYSVPLVADAAQKVMADPRTYDITDKLDVPDLLGSTIPIASECSIKIAQSNSNGLVTDLHTHF
ncbi:MAG: hypothetical protein Q9168_003419 [Polycauliona sp. 1 TL-2023]